jgi:iron-sulfur cluster repair protein YtfE (RIC family)
LDEDLPPEAWSAISAIGVALIGVWVEVVRRATQRNREESERHQEEVKRLVEPVSNGFAGDVRSLLASLTTDVNNMKRVIEDNSTRLNFVQQSQVDLHRRMDSHLEDHVPKPGRGRFFW